MKRLIAILLLIWTATIPVHAQDALSIVFNNNPITLHSAPYGIDGDFMVPVDDVFSQIGIQYDLDEATGRLTTYHDNIFMKYSVGSNRYALNGKWMTLSAVPDIRDEVLYMPLSPLIGALNIRLTFDEATGEIQLNNYALKVFTTYTSYFYRRIDIPEYNASIDIPYYWEQLDDQRRTYGMVSEYENSKVTLYAIQVADNLTIDAYVSSLSAYLRGLYPEARLTGVERAEYESSGFRGLYAAFTYSLLDDESVMGYYVTRVEDLFYIMNFSYDATDAPFIDTIIANIIGSFEVNAFAVNVQEEHYVEYPRFHDTQLTLTEEIYSNRQYRDYVTFAGTISEDVTQLDITVSREGESLVMPVAVTDGVFNQKIYLPFGLGKHNLTVKVHNEAPVYDPERIDLSVSSDILMRFSVINISPAFIRYTIPDGKVISDDEMLVSMAYFLTYDQQTDYAKAYRVFTYLKDNVSLLPEAIGSDPMEVYLTRSGNPQGITYYYASLLRAVGIPTRVYRGYSDLSFQYWVEIYLNGAWSAVDPGGYLNADSEARIVDYFLLRPENFRRGLTNILEITQ